MQWWSVREPHATGDVRGHNLETSARAAMQFIDDRFRHRPADPLDLGGPTKDVLHLRFYESDEAAKSGGSKAYRSRFDSF
jgi:hypothetical protein